MSKRIEPLEECATRSEAIKKMEWRTLEFEKANLEWQANLFQPKEYGQAVCLPKAR